LNVGVNLVYIDSVHFFS